MWATTMRETHVVLLVATLVHTICLHRQCSQSDRFLAVSSRGQRPEANRGYRQSPLLQSAESTTGDLAEHSAPDVLFPRT